MKYGAVIVETRDLPNSHLIISDHMKFLPEDWGLTVFHGISNYETLKKNFPTADLINLQCKSIDSKTLNRLLTSTYFWNNISYDKILMFHPDSGILRTGIEEFLEWDYVGAPWPDKELGGNGGLSIRSKEITLRLIEKIPYMGYNTHDNEDRWVSNNMHLVGGRVAPRDICFKFSCESIYKLGTFGYHAIDKYLTIEQCTKIRNQYNNY